jgi:hypothetical protein
LGIQFGRKKLDALICGDKSGAVLYPSFVFGAEALGITAIADMDDTPAMVQFHARRIQTGWESLVDLFKGSDYRVQIHITSSTVAGFIYLRMPKMALLYIQKSCDLAQARNIQFVPTYGRPPEFSEDLHEILVALSQAIYWANYLFLMCGGPEPRATANLEKDFRRELPVGESPVLSYIELIFYCSELIRFSLRSVL